MEAIIMCLALNIYFEARNQPIEGQVAVAQVVINRVIDERYSDHACDVITQGPTYPDNNLPIRHKCQFSWYCDGKSDRPTDYDAYRWAMNIATGVATEKLEDVTYGATHYHATRVSPDWSYRAHHTVTIGDHIFYRWEHD